MDGVVWIVQSCVTSSVGHWLLIFKNLRERERERERGGGVRRKSGSHIEHALGLVNLAASYFSYDRCFCKHVFVSSKFDRVTEKERERKREKRENLMVGNPGSWL